MLIVEDDEFLAKAFSRAFRNRGYDVHIAATVDKAKAALFAAEFDVVLLDREVAGKDGWALKASLPATTRSVLMTGNPPKDPPVHFLKGSSAQALYDLVDAK